MIKAPSVQKPYDVAFSEDEAFIQLPKDATEEQKEEHLKKWETARETNDYSALRVEGASDPTWFTVRPLTVDQLTGLNGLEYVDQCVMAFRIALVDVRNFGKVDIKRIQHKKFGVIATTEFLDKANLPAGLGARIAIQIGSVAIMKAQGLSPKS